MTRVGTGLIVDGQKPPKAEPMARLVLLPIPPVLFGIPIAEAEELPADTWNCFADTQPMELLP